MRLTRSFFQRDVLEVAPDLLGKVLVRRYDCNEEEKFVITETEAYRGEEDLACHAAKGRTKRTDVLYEAGGVVYIYLIYGMYWLLNIVAGKRSEPQGVLVRGIHGVKGPGRVGRRLELDKSFYGENLEKSRRLWIADNSRGKILVRKSRRIGVDYAGEWAKKPWRFFFDKMIE